MRSLFFFTLTLPLPFTFCEGFLKSGRFSRSPLQKSLDFIQHAFDWGDNEAAIFFAAYRSGALLQSESGPKLGRNH